MPCVTAALRHLRHASRHHLRHSTCSAQARIRSPRSSRAFNFWRSPPPAPTQNLRPGKFVPSLASPCRAPLRSLACCPFASRAGPAGGAARALQNRLRYTLSFETQNRSVRAAPRPICWAAQAPKTHPFGADTDIGSWDTLVGQVFVHRSMVDRGTLSAVPMARILCPCSRICLACSRCSSLASRRAIPDALPRFACCSGVCVSATSLRNDTGVKYFHTHRATDFAVSSRSFGV